MIVSELITHLLTLPQCKSIVCQVVGQDKSGAWNMGFEFSDVPSSWMVQLKVEHPALITLSDTTGWEDGNIHQKPELVEVK